MTYCGDYVIGFGKDSADSIMSPLFVLRVDDMDDLYKILTRINTGDNTIYFQVFRNCSFEDEQPDNICHVVMGSVKRSEIVVVDYDEDEFDFEDFCEYVKLKNSESDDLGAGFQKMFWEA